ncbi:DUF4367 domain-containing protein [Paenibacillus piri]|nr:DUF4367 domain-containing protein [Paenibacillus piri]
MEHNWLLLFRGNIYTLTEQVQRTLFEQYCLQAVPWEELDGLSDESAQRLAGDVFIWAANHSRCFRGLNEGNCASRLREQVRLQAVRLLRQAGQAIGLDRGRTGSDERRAARSHKRDTILSGAWPAVSRRIRRRNRLRLLASKLGAVGFMAAALLIGGLMFGLVTSGDRGPGQQAEASSNRPPDDRPVPAGSDGSTVQSDPLIELKVSGQEAKKYAGFAMGVPTALPSGYTFDEGMVWLREGESKTDHAMLVYTNESGYLLRVSYQKLHKNSALTVGSFMPETRTDVVVRGTKAVFSTTENQFVRLEWMEGNVFVSISGRELDESELIRMAEGLK